jgi:thiosulfate dehydrogenase [quinone] large subunit
MMRESSTGGLTYSGFQTGAMVALRLFIGWHFLYEGLAKVTNPYWTSGGYLAEAKWWFGGIFHDIAARPTLLTFVDYVNEWGLLLVGLGLLLGLFTRWAAMVGIGFLFLYYIAAPPFAGYAYAMPTEGSYLVVNKVLIELVALVVILAFPTWKEWGLDRYLPFDRAAAPAGAAQA